MAITRGGKKAHRQSLRKKAMNDKRKSAIRSALKGARLAPKGDAKASVAILAKAYKAIDKALKTGLLKKNTAARRKAKVAKLLAVAK